MRLVDVVAVGMLLLSYAVGAEARLPDTGELLDQLALLPRIYAENEDVWIPAVQELGLVARQGREGNGPDVHPILWRSLETTLVHGDVRLRVRAAYALGELRILPRHLTDLIQQQFAALVVAHGDAELSAALMHTIGEFQAAREAGEYCKQDIADMLP